MIIGCGTGRSGSTTLTHILDACCRVSATHELRPLLPWIVDPDLYQARRDWLSVPGRADVCSSYLPYLPRFLDDTDTQVVVTRRDPLLVACSATIWLTGTRWHHWYDHGGVGWELDPVWDPAHPTYDIPDRFAAILRYARDYDATVDELAGGYPGRILVVATEHLGERATQRAIFEHAGIPGRWRRYSPGARYNGNPEDRTTQLYRLCRVAEGRPWLMREIMRQYVAD